MIDIKHKLSTIEDIKMLRVPPNYDYDDVISWIVVHLFMHLKTIVFTRIDLVTTESEVLVRV
jgi:DNA topoisomerase IB